MGYKGMQDEWDRSVLHRIVRDGGVIHLQLIEGWQARVIGDGFKVLLI